MHHLEGEVRFMGVFEGFMGKMERCLYPTEGFCPLVRAYAKKFAGKIFGEKLRAPHFPTQGSLVKVLV